MPTVRIRPRFSAHVQRARRVTRHGTLVDALSDVLQAVRLTGAIFFDIQASDPWVAQTPPGEAIVGKMFPGTQHLIPYHIITKGTCWGGLLDQPSMRLETYDII